MHNEKHFLNSETVKDVVIGMADGLTVPFALAAGLSAAVSSTGVIVTAGLAEIVAGSIAMGLGGYLAARTDHEHYIAEEQRELVEIETLRDIEVAEVRDVFTEYGLQGETLEAVVIALTSDKKRWVDFMMKFELGLEKPDPKRAPISALTIAGSYLLGGAIPLFPYWWNHDIKTALMVSVIVTIIALLGFGAIKGYLTGVSVIKSSLQTVFVGGLAAGAAFYLASLFN